MSQVRSQFAEKPKAILSLQRFQTVSQVVVMGIVAVAAIASTGLTALSAAGALPWIELPVTVGGVPVDWAGAALQVTFTIFLLTLCAFFPSSLRVLRLEASHRSFAAGMEDVSRAYWAAHRADRTGIFTLKREFDSVRERYHFLRRHPDLADLDPQIIELASQMSYEARELAQVYSDEKVARAKDMLAQRRRETEKLTDRIAIANAETMELRRMLDDVETDEAVIRSQVSRLRTDLGELLMATGAEAAPGEPRRALLKVAPGE